MMFWMLRGWLDIQMTVGLVCRHTPQALQLKNGVTVMAAGRPGVQLRFSTNGKEWSDLFEMMPFSNDLEAGMTWQGAVSCGYTELLAMGPDRFLIVFSDFKYKTRDGELRKAVKVREVMVKEGSRPLLRLL